MFKYILFDFDGTIFETVEFKPEIITKRLKESAYLNKGLTLNFKDEKNGTETVFYEEEGIKSFVSHITKTAMKDAENTKLLRWKTPRFLTGAKNRPVLRT